MSFCRQRSGFTLVELLVVMVIIGIIAAMIGPAFSSGSDVARVRTAVRGVMQMSRYARTMALLHQTPVDLVFSSDGKLSVVSAGGGGESIVSAGAFSATNAADEAEGEVETRADAEASEDGGGAGYEMAELGISKTYEQVAFVFEGYTDTVIDRRTSRQAAFSGSRSAEEDVSGGEGEARTFSVRYKSNGTCRPFRVSVRAAGDESCAMTLAVDMLGAGKVEEDK